MSTATHRRVGRRNQFPTPCVECGKAAAPGTGELLAKAEGERWKCICDACAAKERYASWSPFRSPDEAAAYYRERFYRSLNEEAQRRYEQAYRPDAPYTPPPCLAALGLDLPTDADQIKRAYREKSKQAHPDAGGSASEFIKLKNAYDSALRLVGAAR